jgi:anti-anti-sigma regulatory factor
MGAWTTKRWPEGNSILLRLVGQFTTAEARAVSQDVAALLEASNSPVELVADLSQLGGFERLAVDTWREHVWRQRSQIRALRVIGARPLMRVVIIGLGLSMGYPVSFVGEPGADALLSRRSTMPPPA